MMHRYLLLLLLLWLTACQADPAEPAPTRQPVATVAQATAIPTQTPATNPTRTPLSTSTRAATAATTQPAATPTSAPVQTATERPTVTRPATYTPTPTSVATGSFGWGNHFQVVDAAGPRTVAFQVDGRATLANLELHSLPFDLFLQHYIANYRPPLAESVIGPIATSGDTLVRQWQMETAVDAPELETDYGRGGTLQQATIPADVPPGLYLLNIPGPAGLQDQMIVALSNHILAANITPGNVAVWVTGMSGQPVADAQIEFWLGETLLGGGMPDSDGLLLAPLDEIPTLITARRGDDLTVLPIDRHQIVSENGTLYVVNWNGQPVQSLWWNIYFPGGDLGVSQTGETGSLGGYSTNTVFRAGMSWYSEHFLWGSFSNGWQQPAFPAVVRRYTAAFILDRPYLHPGQTLSARVVVRQETPGGLLELPTGTPVTLSLDDPSGTQLQTFNLTTSDFGTVHSQFNIPAAADPGEYSLELVVDGESHRQFFWVQPLPDDNYAITVSTDASQYGSDEPIEATVLVQNNAGAPMVNVPVFLAIYNDRDYGFLHHFNPAAPGWNPYTREVGQGRTDNNGRFTVTIRADSDALFYCGTCAIAATLSNDNHTGDFVIIQRANDRIGSSSRISIQPNRQTYNSTDTASLTIGSEVSGPVLLLAGPGDQISYSRLIQLTAPQTVIELPVVANGQPNRHIIVQAWGEGYTSSDPSIVRPTLSLHTGRATLHIIPADKTLQVTITAGQSRYAPGATVPLTIRVTNSQGQPVSAELSLSLADDRLFTHDAANLLSALYRGHPDLSDAFTSMDWGRWLMMRSLDGGPGPGLPFVPALNFDDGAAWFPTLTTDSNGEATLSLTLPDTPGSWRLTAQAITADTQAGETSIVVITE
jgi:uncharacterized protein YfaS (alpha-2-macroglobulin family)